MKKHLILGGAGFIGSHLCDALLLQGDMVTVYDDLSTGRTVNLTRARSLDEQMMKHEDRVQPRLFFYQGDVRDAGALSWHGPNQIHGGFDVVWNLACPASPPAYQRDPIGTMMTCV